MSADSDAAVTSPNESGPSAPIGYCPHCDYQLLAPGVCPECGKDIPSHRMRRRPRNQRRRQTVKTFAWATLALGLVVGLRTAYQANLHYRLFTNASLIDAYPSDPIGVQEIQRRLGVDAFSVEEVETLVMASCTYEVAVNKYNAADAPLGFRVIVTEVPGALFGVSIAQTPASWLGDDTRLNETTVATRATSFMMNIGGGVTAFENHYETRSAVEPGDYTLSVPLNYRAKWESCINNAAILERFESPFSTVIKATLNVSDSLPPGRVLTDERRKQILENFRLAVCSDDGTTFEFRLCAGPHPKLLPFKWRMTMLEGNRIRANKRGSQQLYARQPSPDAAPEIGVPILKQTLPDFIDRVEVEILIDLATLETDAEEPGAPIIVRWDSVAIRSIPLAHFDRAEACTSCDDDFAYTPNEVQHWDRDAEAFEAP